MDDEKYEFVRNYFTCIEEYVKSFSAYHIRKAINVLKSVSAAAKRHGLGDKSLTEIKGLMEDPDAKIDGQPVAKFFNEPIKDVEDFAETKEFKDFASYISKENNYIILNALRSMSTKWSPEEAKMKLLDLLSSDQKSLFYTDDVEKVIIQLLTVSGFSENSTPEDKETPLAKMAIAVYDFVCGLPLVLKYICITHGLKDMREKYENLLYEMRKELLKNSEHPVDEVTAEFFFPDMFDGPAKEERLTDVDIAHILVDQYGRNDSGIIVRGEMRNIQSLARYAEAMTGRKYTSLFSRLSEALNTETDEDFERKLKTAWKKMSGGKPELY